MKTSSSAAPASPSALPATRSAGFDYRAYFEEVAQRQERAQRFQGGFHAQIAGLLRHHILPGQRVLELGCARGDLLAALEPSRGLGLDLSPRQVERARAAHGGGALEFREHNVLEGLPVESFDAIVMDYLIGYLPDVQRVLENLQTVRHARTRLYLTSLNFAWKPALVAGQRLGLLSRQPPSNWLSSQDLINLLELAGWEVVVHTSEQLLPFEWPLASPLCNRLLVRLPLLRHLGCTLFLVARPKMEPKLSGEIACSVVVPTRNESGNIRAALEGIPTLGRRTEVIFVEGHSTDDTWEVVQREGAAYAGPHAVSWCQQPGKGKWDAVYEGFKRAKGDVLVILDGDLTVPPAELGKFYEALLAGSAEFVNGSRLVYPMENGAMRFLNFLGNKFFATLLSFILGQPVKDSLCGTKMLLRSDFERLMERIEEFGDFDPFGDFNLLFGSSLLDLKIRDVPIRYRERTYGDTNIRRFFHGQILLRMSWFGLWKLRFHSLRTREARRAAEATGRKKSQD
ncbi:MAG: glycosyltransferase [Opitutales bacterium]